MSGVRGVWRRLVDGASDLVAEEMFALEMRKLRSALDRSAADPQPAVLLKDRLSFGGPVEPRPMPVIPEEIAWPA